MNNSFVPINLEEYVANSLSDIMGSWTDVAIFLENIIKLQASFYFNEPHGGMYKSYHKVTALPLHQGSPSGISRLTQNFWNHVSLLAYWQLIV
jgi:hypothetical protein